MHSISLTGLLFPVLGAAAQAADTFDLGALAPPGATGVESFAHAIEVEGDRMVVADLGSIAWELDGEVDVFQRVAGEWTAVATLSPAQPPSPTEWVRSFGWSVALDGDRVVVGASREDWGDDVDVGAAYVFDRQPDGAWTETARLVPSDPQVDGEFGSSVALDGDRILIGSPNYHQGSLADAGAVFAFELDPATGWVETDRIDPPVAMANDNFGRSVALDGGRAIVGAPGDFPFPSAPPGRAAVFELQPDATWAFAAALVPGSLPGVQDFGSDVALVGDVAICTAPYVDTAFVFERDAGGGWPAVADLAVGAGSGVGSTGDKLVVDFDGARAVLGDRNGLSTEGFDGWAAVFDRAADGSWSAGPLLTGGSPLNADFGGAVAVAGDDVFVGESVDGPGQVWVYRLCDGCAEVVGAGTPGCHGPHELRADTAPVVGWTLEVTTTLAPGSPSIGFLGLGDAVDPLGGDPLGLGAALYLDPLASSFLILFPLDGGDGEPTQFLPIPDDPSLVDLQLVLQSFWLWGGCNGSGPFTSSSSGLVLRIEAP